MPFDAGPYQDLQREIDRALDKGLYLLGPEATKLLLQLESELRSFVGMMASGQDTKLATSRAVARHWRLGSKGLAATRRIGSQVG